MASTMRSLEIHAGPLAMQRIRQEGFHRELFDTLVGASGGPKWLVLSALDKLLFPWLLRERQSTLSCIGSSIGCWRHLCLAQDDPTAATARLEEAYLAQGYSDRPTPQEISTVARSILQHALGRDGAAQLTRHTLLHSHIVVARGRGIWRSRNTLLLGAAAAGTFAINAFQRSALDAVLERCCLHNELPSPPLQLPRLRTRHLALKPALVAEAALASASIPLLAAGVDALIPGELCWDGGMTDYHFEPDFGAKPGLTLYPHFYPLLVPGWFDKALPWRRRPASSYADLVVLAPSREFIAALPGGRIPDRSDFRRMSLAERQRRWRLVLAQGARLAEDLASLLDGRWRP
jgi:hypothetical protein